MDGDLGYRSLRGYPGKKAFVALGLTAGMKAGSSGKWIGHSQELSAIRSCPRFFSTSRPAGVGESCLGKAANSTVSKPEKARLFWAWFAYLKSW